MDSSNDNPRWEWVAPEGAEVEQRVDPVVPSPSPAVALAAPAGPAPPPMPVPLRPLTVADVLDGSWRILKARPRTVVGVTAALVVPLVALAAVLQGSAASAFDLGAVFGTTAGASSAGPQTGDLLLLYFVAALSALTYSLLGGALAVLVQGWAAGRDDGAGAVLRRTLPRMPALAAAWFVGLWATLLFGCLGGIGALVPMTFLYVVAPAIATEESGPLVGLRRSFELVRRRFFWVLAVVVLATLAEWVVGGALSMLPQLLGLLLPEAVATVTSAVVQSLVVLVTAPTLVGVAVLTYLDLRIRAEGLDLSLRADAAFARA